MFISSPFLYRIYITIIGRTILTLISPNWITAWIILEINILSFLPIICIPKINQETEAATKYFLVQAFGSLILLAGSVILYQPKIRIFILVTLMLALLLKLGAFPCHFWYPSIIASISWRNCLILSTWQKIAPLSLLSVISNYTSSKALLVIAGINALTGGLIGINQTRLRALLAYSSIGHLGWIMRIIALNITFTWIFYFLIYCLAVTPVFLLFIITNSKTIFDLFNLHKIHFLMPAITIILILSLAGIPPLTGFLPKLMVVSSMIHSNFFVLLILLVGSYINLYYYLRIAIASMISFNSPTHSSSIHIRILPFLIVMSSSLIGTIILIYALITLN